LLTQNWKTKITEQDYHSLKSRLHQTMAYFKKKKIIVW